MLVVVFHVQFQTLKVLWQWTEAMHWSYPATYHPHLHYRQLPGFTLRKRPRNCFTYTKTAKSSALSSTGSTLVIRQLETSV